MHHPSTRARSRSAQGHLADRALQNRAQQVNSLVLTEAISLFPLIFPECVLGRGTGQRGKGRTKGHPVLAFSPVQRAPPGSHCRGTRGAWSRSDEGQQCHSESSPSSHCLIYPDLWVKQTIIRQVENCGFLATSFSYYKWHGRKKDVEPLENTLPHDLGLNDKF